MYISHYVTSGQQSWPVAIVIAATQGGSSAVWHCLIAVQTHFSARLLCLKCNNSISTCDKSSYTSSLHTQQLQSAPAVADAARLWTHHHGLVVRLRERVHQLHVEFPHQHTPDRLSKVSTDVKRCGDTTAAFHDQLLRSPYCTQAPQMAKAENPPVP